MAGPAVTESPITITVPYSGELKKGLMLILSSDFSGLVGYSTILITECDAGNVINFVAGGYRRTDGNVREFIKAVQYANGVFTLNVSTFGGYGHKVAFLQLDLDGTSSGVTKKKMKFTIKLMPSTTTQYEAEEGMTWEQWVNSAYNTDGFFIRTYSSTLELVDKTQNFALTITSTDTITADKTYTMGPARNV